MSSTLGYDCFIRGTTVGRYMAELESVARDVTRNVAVPPSDLSVLDDHIIQFETLLFKITKETNDCIPEADKAELGAITDLWLANIPLGKVTEKNIPSNLQFIPEEIYSRLKKIV